MIPTNPIITARKVCQILSDRTGYTQADIMGPKREKGLATVRHVLVATMKELGYSYPECARAFGRTDHTTAMNSVRVVRQNAELMGLAVETAELVRGMNGTLDKPEPTC